ncbi:MAG: hypothetical protein U9Q19_02690 [Pseudomonadota bacterium]|nr:hypothetical protein [Pseudomonadota bacterium]
MAVSILSFSNGDTDYIAKHNANYQNVKVAIEALQNAIATQAAGGDASATVATAYDALFGPNDSVLGEGSYLPSQSAAHNLSIAAGHAYVTASDAVVSQSTSTGLDLSGQTTGTYYIHVDSAGVPSFDQVSADALYSVYYDSGTGNFSNITRVGNLAWTYVDWENAQTNLWGINYNGLDDRLTGIEGSSYGVLQKTAVATDITLTTQEALEQSLIEVADGPQTVDINLIVPTEARVYQMVNNASATYGITVKTSGGTGYKVMGNHYAVLYCDGVNTVALFDLDRSSGGAPPDSFKVLTDTPAAYTGDTLKFARVNAGETGLEFHALVWGDIGGTLSNQTDLQSALDGKSGTGHTHSYLADLTGSPFTELSDTPANYTSAGGYTVKVNSGATALEFVNESSAVTTFIGLSDTPANYTSSGGHAVKVNAGATALEYVDDPYFVSGFLPGKPAVSAISLVHVFAVATSFPSGLTGSQATGEAAATAQTDFDVQKNGVSVGTIRFAAAGTTATFIMASTTAFAIGDKMQIIAPGTQDATLSDVAITLNGTR